MEGVAGLILESIRRYGMPFPVDKRVCSGWTDSLPRRGDTLIFTSCMYQVEPVVPFLLKFSSLKSSGKLLPLARAIKPPAKELERAYVILRKIVSALQREGINVAYMYEEEPYSGALLLEIGLLEEFAEHARKVASLFKERGVRRVITVDPHTHNALKRYSEFIPFDTEVVSYLELVKPSLKGEETRYTIHDSCLYSRFLNLRDTYRSLLSEVNLTEDFLVTGKDTSSCCGGPVGGVDPVVSEKIAKRRAEELNKLSDNLIVTCPICYVTLSPHFKGRVRDIAEVVL